MSFTVSDAMGIYPLSRGKIISGKGGVGNVVKSISVLEIPEDTKFIVPGELEISALYSIADSPEKQADVIRMLKKYQASALILFYVGAVIPFVDPLVTDLSDQLAFPIIVMPENIAYTDVIIPIVDKIMATQNRYLNAAMHIHDEITALLLSEKDFSTMVGRLSEIIERQVLYFDYANLCLANSGIQLHKDYLAYIISHIEKQVQNKGSTNDVYIPSLNNNDKILLAPISSNINYYGMMVIMPANDLSELDFVAISQTKNALGIMTLNKINLKEYNDIRRADFISDFISGGHGDESSILQRASSLGISLDGIRAVMVLDIYSFAKFSAKMDEDQKGQIKDAFFNKVKTELAYLTPLSLYYRFSDKILILYYSGGGEEYTMKMCSRLGRHLQNIVQETLNLSVSVGVGSYCAQLDNIPGSYTTASHAVSISNKVFHRPNCVLYSSLRVYALLEESNLAQPKVEKAVGNLFAPIIQHDNENNSQLLETLRSLLDYNFNTSLVAEKMFLHKNTILQRKKKIASLFPVDIFEPAWTMQLKLAFTLLDLCG